MAADSCGVPGLVLLDSRDRSRILQNVLSNERPPRGRVGALWYPEECRPVFSDPHRRVLRGRSTCFARCFWRNAIRFSVRSPCHVLSVRSVCRRFNDWFVYCGEPFRKEALRILQLQCDIAAHVMEVSIVQPRDAFFFKDLEGWLKKQLTFCSRFLENTKITRWYIHNLLRMRKAVLLCIGCTCWLSTLKDVMDLCYHDGSSLFSYRKT